ncbi:MAG: hypothetical protein GY929_11020 [Actinomycetia bacterium]|nr:hypothetical protein [Actinomycetes bacterium]
MDGRGEGAGTDEPVARLLTGVLLAELGLLAVTGIFLVFFYRPTAAAAWDDLYALDTSNSFGLAVRTLHRLLSWLTLLTTASLGVALVAGRPREPGRWALGPTLMVATVSATFTGFLLPWDQLALWAVTPGSNMMGFMPVIYGDQVRFVLINGAEVSQEEIRRAFYVHIAIGIATLGAVVWLARELGRRRRPTPVTDSSPSPPLGG